MNQIYFLMYLKCDEINFLGIWELYDDVINKNT
jgi:hypothetical protein